MNGYVEELVWIRVIVRRVRKGRGLWREDGDSRFAMQQWWRFVHIYIPFFSAQVLGGRRVARANGLV